MERAAPGGGGGVWLSGPEVAGQPRPRERREKQSLHVPRLRAGREVFEGRVRVLGYAELRMSAPEDMVMFSRLAAGASGPHPGPGIREIS